MVDKKKVATGFLLLLVLAGANANQEGEEVNLLEDSLNKHKDVNVPIEHKRSTKQSIGG